MQEPRPLALIFGGTGLSGFHITNELIERGFAVRMFCRSKDKVTKLFQQREIGFESIIEGDANNSEDIERAFKTSEHFGNVKYVINALGVVTPADVENITYVSQVNIVEESKKAKVQKFVLISASFVTKAWNLMIFLLNTLLPSMMHWKMKAENYLRTSGLNYIIIRPVQLTGNTEDTTLTNYEIGQGDRISGTISRYTVGKLTVQAMLSKEIPEKVTFECRQQKSEENSNFALLQPDTQANVINPPHILAKRVYSLVFLSIIVGGLYLMALKFGWFGLS